MAIIKTGTQRSKLAHKALNFDPRFAHARNDRLPNEMEKEEKSQGSLSKKFTSEYLMGPSVKHQAGAKPVTNADKVMSDEHKRKRREIDSISSTVGRLTSSIKYNKIHRDEHDKALKTATRTLKNHLNGKLASKYMEMK